METLNKHFRKITEPVFKKHGFAQGDVLAHWPQIVGSQLAAFSTPERIRWPRTKAEGENPSAPVAGTLHVRAHAGRMLDVQYASEAILEKVNGFLGYQAVARLKVVQNHRFEADNETPGAAAIPSHAILQKVSDIQDPGLQQALARLGAEVSGLKTRSPQAK